MNENISPHIYHVGRPLGEFKKPYQDTDRTFAGQRLENDVEEADYKHCTLINIGFKEVTFRNSKFFNCIFVGCYFRRAQLKNCSFQGCQFFDCKFPRISISVCDFRYSSFSGCQISFSEIEHSLPTEPNLKEELSRNLAQESLRLGLFQESKRYKTVRINAHEQHLKAAFCGDSQWYKDHFDTRAQIYAFFEWLLSMINRHLWGYGEKIWTLIRNLILLIVTFSVIFSLVKEELIHESGKSITFIDIMYFSLENTLPAGVSSGITAVGGKAQLIAGLESLVGVVITALFAAYIFRWSIQR